MSRRAGTSKVDGGIIWAGDPRLRLPTAHRLNETQAEALLARVACPTLLIGLPGEWRFRNRF